MRGFLESSSAVTPTIVVAELFEKYRRLAEEFGARFEFIRSRSRLAVLDEDLARTAGLLNFGRKKKVRGWGMSDSIVLATALLSKARVVTGDPHFEDLKKETILI